MNNEWIKVSDRVPEAGTAQIFEVTVLYANGARKVRYSAYYKKFDGVRPVAYWHVLAGKQRVIAWREINDPKPYMGEI